MIKIPLIEHLSPGAKFIMLLLLTIVCLFTILSLGLMAAAPLMGGNVLDMMARTPENMLGNIAFLKYFQIVSQIGFFIVPVIVYSYLIEGKPVSYLCLNLKPDTISLLVAVGLTVISVPLINLMLEWNEMLRLPGSLANLENWMKSTEESSEELTRAFLDTSQWGGFLANMLMIAILPAVGEEFLFRGALTRIFFEWTRNKHVAILISAFLFSALHLQFYGFLPRFALGVLLGYLFVLSGNLWMPIVAHFFNNVFVVISAFLFRRGILSTDLNELEATDNIWVTIISFIATCLLIIVYYQRNRKKGETPVE